MLSIALSPHSAQSSSALENTPQDKLPRPCRLGWASIFAFVAGLTTGCGPAYPPCEPSQYLLAEARASIALGVRPGVHVSTTPEYHQLHAQWFQSERATTVAIRAPDDCLAARTPGVSHSSTQPTQAGASCGLWLTTLERALANSGLRVVSWDSLQSLQASQNLPWFHAAKQLGADLLLVLASLDTSGLPPGARAEWSIKYFHSDPAGTRRGAFTLDADTRAPVKGYVEQNLSAQVAPHAASGAPMALSASVNATAVTTNTGRSVWFFQSAQAMLLPAASGRRFLFRRADNLWYPEVVTPTTAVVAATPQPDPGSRTKATLVQAMATELVSQLQRGTAQ